MPHRKGNKIRTISDEELARQACDLWDKFEFVPIMARFLTLHDELDRRHGGKGGGAQFINAEKKRRNAVMKPYPKAPPSVILNDLDPDLLAATEELNAALNAAKVAWLKIRRAAGKLTQ